MNNGVASWIRYLGVTCYRNGGMPLVQALRVLYRPRDSLSQRAGHRIGSLETQPME